jgi:myo-inositol-1-phosphate synthase
MNLRGELDNVTNTDKPHIDAPSGKLGVLLPGLGAVATTFIAGVEATRRGVGRPIGSLTQMGTIRLGKRTDKRMPLIKDFVQLADLNAMVFGAWDPIPDDALKSAQHCGVLKDSDLREVGDFLETIKPMPAVFSTDYVKKLEGTNVKKGKNKTARRYSQLQKGERL